MKCYCGKEFDFVTIGSGKIYECTNDLFCNNVDNPSIYIDGEEIYLFVQLKNEKQSFGLFGFVNEYGVDASKYDIIVDSNTIKEMLKFDTIEEVRYYYEKYSIFN